MLPHKHLSRVERGTVASYLLSPGHPNGCARARFFVAHGFVASEWYVLAAALRMIGMSNPVVNARVSPYGTRCIVDGVLPCPDGGSNPVRTVWIIEPRRVGPRFVTAFPW